MSQSERANDARVPRWFVIPFVWFLPGLGGSFLGAWSSDGHPRWLVVAGVLSLWADSMAWLWLIDYRRRRTDG